MSIWLAKALAARAHSSFDCTGECANCAKTSTDLTPEGSFGTNGTIGTASGVPTDEIRARFVWIVHRLVEEHGRAPEHARRDARAILRSELLNDVRLAPVQADTHRCFVCGRTGTPARVLVPVLTARPDVPLWLHIEPCHDEHRRHRMSQVNDLLTAALSRLP